MPTPKRFRYAFKTADNTGWYYVDGDKVKISTTRARYLYDSPVDWRQSAVGMARNEFYHGLFRRFSVPLTFTFDGLTILKHVYTNNGCEGTVIFVMEVNHDIYNTYSEEFRGEVDFSMVEATFNDNEWQLKVTLLERGLPELLKSNVDVPYEIPFDSQALTMHHDGIKLNVSYTWVTGELSPVSVVNNLSGTGYIIPMVISVREGEKYINNFIKFQDAQHEVWPLANTPNDDNKFLYTVNDIENVKYRWRAKIQVDSVIGATLFAEIIRKDFSNNSRALLLGIYTSAQFDNSTTLTIDVSGIIPEFLGNIYNYFLSLRMEGLSGGTTSLITILESKFELNFNYRIPSSEIKAYPYLTFLNKLFKAAMGNEVAVISQYLSTNQNYHDNYDNNPKWTTVTCGTAIRNLPNPKIKTSIADAFQDMRRWGLGLAIENGNVRVEPLRYFYQYNRKVLKLKSIKALRYLNANDFLGNIIKTGYKAQTNDDLNALQDFHSESIWRYPINRIRKEINWTSPYQASIFAIEYARSLGFGTQDTTDSRYDDEIYLIEVDPTSTTGGRPNLYRPSGTKMGLLNPDSSYNWGLSPATTLHFNKPLLTAMGYLQPLITGTLKFQTNEKNPAVARQLNSIPIHETASLPMLYWNKDADGNEIMPLFLPVMFEIDAVVPDILFELMDANVENRYGVVEFPWNGHTFAIFINDVVLNKETKDVYTIRGISSPLNDLTKL